MAASARTVARAARTWTWKDIALPLVSAVFGAFLLLNVVDKAFIAWAPTTPIHDPEVMTPIMHAWHYALMFSHIAFLMAPALLALVWKPRQRPLVMQYVAGMGLSTAAFDLAFRPDEGIILGVGTLILIALYPGFRALLARPQLRGGSKLLLGLTALITPVLLYNMVRLTQWAIMGVGGDHATAGHWINSAAIWPTVILAGFLAATKRPGWQLLAIAAGLFFVYTGAASIALATFDGSWGPTFGWAGVVVGLAYLALTAYEIRRRS
jgi:hypothetical protein